MRRDVDPAQLVGATEIGARLDVDRKTVHLWRSRHDDFPEPVATIERTMVWYWPDVERWARKTGRIDRR